QSPARSASHALAALDGSRCVHCMRPEELNSRSSRRALSAIVRKVDAGEGHMPFSRSRVPRGSWCGAGIGISKLEVDERGAAVAPHRLDQQQDQPREQADGPGGDAMVDAIEVLEQVRTGELDEEPERDQQEEKWCEQAGRLRPVDETGQDLASPGGTVGTEGNPAQADKVERECDCQSLPPEGSRGAPGGFGALQERALNRQHAAMQRA